MPGGPLVHGRWYFTDQRATTQSNYGSLIWWKDDDDAVFSGIGEVDRGAWVNGAAVPCNYTSPCLHSFTAEFPGYNTVDFTYAGTGSGGTQVSGDTWTSADYPTGTHNYFLQSVYGAPVAGCMGLRVVDSGTGSQVWTTPISIDASTHTYTYLLNESSLADFPLGPITAKLSYVRPPPGIRQYAQVHGHQLASYAATFGSPTLANSRLGGFFAQYGFQLSGGPLSIIPAPTGWARPFTTANFWMNLYDHTPGIGETGATLPGTSTADNGVFTIFECTTPAGAPIIPGGSYGTDFTPSQTSLSQVITSGAKDTVAVVQFAWTRTTAAQIAAPVLTLSGGTLLGTQLDLVATDTGIPVSERQSIMTAWALIPAGTSLTFTCHSTVTGTWGVAYWQIVPT